MGNDAWTSDPRGGTKDRALCFVFCSVFFFAPSLLFRSDEHLVHDSLLALGATVPLSLLSFLPFFFFFVLSSVGQAAVQAAAELTTICIRQFRQLTFSRSFIRGVSAGFGLGGAGSRLGGSGRSWAGGRGDSGSGLDGAAGFGAGSQSGRWPRRLGPRPGVGSRLGGSGRRRLGLRPGWRGLRPGWCRPTPGWIEGRSASGLGPGGKGPNLGGNLGGKGAGPSWTRREDALVLCDKGLWMLSGHNIRACGRSFRAGGLRPAPLSGDFR